MKRLLGLLLVMGIVGCGGDAAELHKLGVSIEWDGPRIVRVTGSKKTADEDLIGLKGMTSL